MSRLPARAGPLFLALLLLLQAGCTREPAPEGPSLVLLVIVDQLRGDMPERVSGRMGEGGFRYLLESGTHYTNAHFSHANTETAVGHATIVTGAHPSVHGIVGNGWRDPESGRPIYALEDDRHHVLGEPARPRQGTSPRNLLASTIGDQLVESGAGLSRVFAVSGKDRGAILPAGRIGKAFWYSRGSGGFVTSSYYYDELPGWVDSWNARKPADRYRGKEWKLLHPRETYEAAGWDDRPYEANLVPLGRTFPHAHGEEGTLNFYSLLLSTPAGDELTLDFVKRLIEEERIGQGPGTDLLAVSFSCTDYIGHLFGPASLEAEDNLLRLDRLLAGLFRHVDEEIGLDRTLVVVTGDHGVAEAAEQMAGLPHETGRVPFDWYRKGPVADALEERFGRDDLVLSHTQPYIYLNGKALAEAGLEAAEVERFLAQEAEKLPGIARALTRADILSGTPSDDPVEQMVRRNFFHGRSGNLHVVQEPYWFLDPNETAWRLGIATGHGSPWSYDTHVPILIAGPDVPARTVTRSVSPIDIAPTIAAWLGIEPPPEASGIPLLEALGR